MKKIFVGVGIVIVFLGVMIWIVKLGHFAGQAFGAVTSSDYVYNVGNVVGTHIGTSTTGVAVQIITSTYISKVVSGNSKAIYTVRVTSVASTTNNIAFSFEGSNDFKCDTALTSTLNEVLVSDINWYGIGDHLLGKIQSTSLSNASSTNIITWNNTSPNLGQDITLTDLNFECLRLGVSGTSTAVYIGLKTQK